MVTSNRRHQLCSSVDPELRDDNNVIIIIIIVTLQLPDTAYTVIYKIRRLCMDYRSSYSIVFILYMGIYRAVHIHQLQ